MPRDIDQKNEKVYAINTLVEEKQKIILLGRGNGYAGFCVSFEFDETGKFISHGVWE